MLNKQMRSVAVQERMHGRIDRWIDVKKMDGKWFQ